MNKTDGIGSPNSSSWEKRKENDMKIPLGSSTGVTHGRRLSKKAVETKAPVPSPTSQGTKNTISRPLPPTTQSKITQNTGRQLPKPPTEDETLDEALAKLKSLSNELFNVDAEKSDIFQASTTTSVSPEATAWTAGSKPLTPKTQNKNLCKEIMTTEKECANSLQRAVALLQFVDSKVKNGQLGPIFLDFSTAQRRSKDLANVLQYTENRSPDEIVKNFVGLFNNDDDMKVYCNAFQKAVYHQSEILNLDEDFKNKLNEDEGLRKAFLGHILLFNKENPYNKFKFVSTDIASSLLEALDANESLNSLCMAVVQRIPRHILLLDQLHANFGKDFLSKLNVSKPLQIMKNAVEVMNLIQKIDDITKSPKARLRINDKGQVEIDFHPKTKFKNKNEKTEVSINQETAAMTLYNQIKKLDIPDNEQLLLLGKLMNIEWIGNIFLKAPK